MSNTTIFHLQAAVPGKNRARKNEEKGKHGNKLLFGHEICTLIGNVGEGQTLEVQALINGAIGYRTNIKERMNTVIFSVQVRRANLVHTSSFFLGSFLAVLTELFLSRCLRDTEKLSCVTGCTAKCMTG